MRRADAGVRRELDARLAELGRQTPEWQVWTGLFGEALRELDHPAWTSLCIDPSTEDAIPGRATAPEGADAPGSAPGRATAPEGADAPGSAGAPLLHGRTLFIDASRLRRLVRRLAETAAAGSEGGGRSLAHYRPSSDDALRLVATAVRDDSAEIEGRASAAGIDPAALETVAELAALPLLHSCGRLLQEQVSLSWPHGYCPICGRWPVFAELRGLRGSRRLRCGRCGGDWQVDWLRCVYCGERDHEQLGSLAPVHRRETLRVETCKRCGGFLKTIATLQAIPPFELLLRDLETVELDLVALDRGYSRPRGSGFALEVRLSPRTSRPIRPLRRDA
jgi:FdhE protein